jgi:hypothetical protein
MNCRCILQLRVMSPTQEDNKSLQMEVSIGHADAWVGRMLNAAWIKAKNMTYMYSTLRP